MLCMWYTLGGSIHAVQFEGEAGEDGESCGQDKWAPLEGDRPYCSFSTGSASVQHSWPADTKQGKNTLLSYLPNTWSCVFHTFLYTGTGTGTALTLPATP